MENQFVFYIFPIKLNKTFINRKRVWFWYIKQISVQRDFSKRWNAFSSLCFQKYWKEIRFRKHFFIYKAEAHINKSFSIEILCLSNNWASQTIVWTRGLQRTYFVQGGMG